MASVSAVLLQRSSSRAREYLRLQRTASYSVALHLEGEGLRWWWSNSCGRGGRFGARAAHRMAGSGEGENGGVPAGGEVAMAPGVVTGGVEDAYGEDRATEDQPVTPWAVCIATSGHSLLRDPRHNKGLSFTEKERDAHYLRGLLPPVVLSQDLQEKRMLQNVRQFQVPLLRYTALMDLQERNERLFYKLLIDNVEELLPVVYTPTVGEACQKYGSIFRRPQGLYVSLKDKGRILEVLRNWPEKSIQVIVVTDGERILGLGDLGCQGMGIPVGKLALYTALGGVRPSACLPITIDVGTNNEDLLKDEFYIGLKQRRATGQEYSELLDEFMAAVRQNYGQKVLVQFEDFANHNAFTLLEKYRTNHLVFNDDIQGTAAVVLAGLIAALKSVGGTLADHTFLFFGAGEAGTGIAELVALEISRQAKVSVEVARKKIWLVDSKGLIVTSRKETLQPFKKRYAHEHEPVKDLLGAVKAVRPTALIGSAGVGQSFTKEVIEAMSSINERPIILALSNPTSQSECTAEQAYTWSQGRAIFGSGSPFDPVKYNDKLFVPAQANNAYIFPGFGLGVVISGAVRVSDDMVLAAAEGLAEQVTPEHIEKGLIYPPFSIIRKISANIAARVAAKAYDLGMASQLPRPKDLVKYAESCMYSPVYRSYR
ncbi:NADP-dependent malic enzyme-like [Miscanthus floridulus]|uniref:NADP-dependent malic enzyme-like n=1 Tax=Miscanthus floridulus TaxID=154761 RepID=UPI00345985DA